MLRTGIPVSTWEQEGDAVINTAVDMLNEQTEPKLPEGAIDPFDDATIPGAWLR